jgi:small ligand-binding sensory domain FIST
MTEFRAAHAGAGDWRHAVARCVGELGPLATQHRLGFLYVTDYWADALEEIAAMVRGLTGIEDWIGTVGLGICTGGKEDFDEPAMAMMVAALPPDCHRLFPAVSGDLEAFRRHAGGWIAARQGAFGIVHADPRNPKVAVLIEDLAEEVGFLVGGLTSSRRAYGQLAGGLAEGGVSGALFAGEVAVVTGLSQGCSPIGPVRTITECAGNLAVAIDGRPALEVFKEDIGELLARDLRQVAGYVYAAFPIAGTDTGDYLVRNLVGVVPDRGWIAIAETLAEGARIMFCRRDRASAEADLRRMLADVTRRAGGPPKGALYVSCLARGPNLFGDDSQELGIVRQAIGEVPLVGFFANGEISHNRLYGYTGVVTLFL